MSATQSTMLALGTRAPEFSLPDTEGNPVSLSDFPEAKAIVVAFICNHCPYVINLREALAALARTYQARGVAVVAISSNDTEKYPDDSPQKMRTFAEEAGFTFPYCYDATQAVAKAYRAACTPDFFVFDGDQKLTYRGQFDASRPGNAVSPNGADLAAALEATLSGKAIAESEQQPSIGCNIKWKPGNEPDYFG